MSEAALPAFTRRLSDERLTRRAVEGDEHAFAAIFRRYHQSLYRFCLAIVGNPEDAQDALQNTMIKVLRALPGEERQVELKPWLYRIAHNESIDLLRRRRETRQLDVEQIAPGYGLAEDAATRERLRQLIADLKELPSRQREVLVMREMAGLDFEEIGIALDTSGAVARQTLYEARRGLRQMGEGREMSCDEVTRALSDGDGRVVRRRDVRAHLRSCAACRAFREEIKGRQRDLAALAPLPAVAAAGMLQGMLGGSQGVAGGGLAATLGGGAAKTIGASAAAKGIASAAVVAAIGVTAADRTGVIHLGLPGEQTTKQAKLAPGDNGKGSASVKSASGLSAGPSGDVHGNGSKAGGRSAEAGGAAGQVRSSVGQAGAQLNPTPASGNGHAGHPAQENAGSGSQGIPAAPSPGQEHETQHPAAAPDGQETAADHKPPPPEAGDDAVGEEDGAAPAAKPSHPSPPSAPSPPVANEPPGGPPENPPAPAPEPPAPAAAPASEHGPPAEPPGWAKAEEKRP
jgi:RNA polymerase sigma factor (sigma-70 family)